MRGREAMVQADYLGSVSWTGQVFVLANHAWILALDTARTKRSGSSKSR